MRNMRLLSGQGCGRGSASRKPTRRVDELVRYGIERLQIVLSPRHHDRALRPRDEESGETARRRCLDPC